MENESKNYKFRKIAVLNIADDSAPDVIDVSQVVGNVFYNQTNDISMLDKAREIYYKGETTFNQREANHFLEVITQSPLLIAPVKVAIRKMFNV